MHTARVNSSSCESVALRLVLFLFLRAILFFLAVIKVVAVVITVFLLILLCLSCI